MKTIKWIQLFFMIPTLIISFILIINYIIDPYSVTQYNILNISNKLVGDDRVEKVAKLKSSPKYNNIILGSSRIYSTNPLLVSNYLGGSTYNAGVGTARIEDHLGFLLILKRENRLPDNLIIALDFYSFNIEVETNSYFLKNHDLNFISSSSVKQNYISNFLSIDAFKASLKTLKNHFKAKQSKPRFDINGAANGASKVFTYIQESKAQNTLYPKALILKELQHTKTLKYPKISTKRISYLKEIISICKTNNINLYTLITPLNGQLLKSITSDKILKKRLIEFKNILAENISFYDFLLHNSIIDNAANFTDPTHTNILTGNLMYAKIFNDSKIKATQDFGKFIKCRN